tara:strand:- start:1897 stop:2148 length:252 start_codon:yes stop_codon:yes gene_type:complete
MDAFLREKIETSDLNELSLQIEVYEKIIDFYVRYEEENGAYEYTTERILYFNNIYAEYLVARQIAIEGASYPRVIGEGPRRKA